MKHKILKKTIIYRLLSLGLTTFITTLYLWNEPFTSMMLTIWTEIGAVVLYYTYEWLWERRINKINLKDGMRMWTNKMDKHGWYKVIEDLGNGKLLIEVE